ncbi:MAG: SGNH/GDSL hydrolase family protein [Planctomycetaceae bacterium]|nr:SGNH/GDSL hydrolase family protein [Planctomycetaceae bacterium]
MLQGPTETAFATRVQTDTDSERRKRICLRAAFAAIFSCATACVAWGYSANQPLAFFGGLAACVGIAAGWLRMETAPIQHVGWMVWQRCAAAILMLGIIESGYWLHARRAAAQSSASSQSAAATLQPVSFSQAKGDPYAFSQWWFAYAAEWYRDKDRIQEWTPDKPYPYVFRPNTSRPFVRGTVSVNSHQLCDREVPFDKGDKYRIVVMGSSHTQCPPVEATDTPWPSKLERLIHERLDNGRQVEVLNAGAAGYTMIENLHRLRDVVLPLKPDMIITYFGYNEFGEFRKEFKLQASVPSLKPRPSKLLGKIDWRMKKWLAKARVQTEPLENLDELAPRLAECRLANVYREYLKIARDNGISLVVCNFNMAVDENSPEEVIQFYEDGFPKVRGMVQANRLNTAMLPLIIGKEPGSRLIDVHEGLNGHCEPNYLDLVHLSEPGKAQLAENVYRGIVDLLPKASSPASPAPHTRLTDRVDANSSQLR